MRRLTGLLRPALLAGLLCLQGAAQAAPFSLLELPTATPGIHLTALQRAAPLAPARYRVILLPGSGCSGLQQEAPRMLRGLAHAQLLLLHKPGVDPAAGPAPRHCPPGFSAADDLGRWLADARAALAAHQQSLSPTEAALPLLLLGFSEGAELLPFLAPQLPGLQGLVMIGGSGLDPQEAGALQAERLGESAHWRALAEAQASDLDDEEMRDGRSLRYWRSLWAWRSEAALLAAPQPLLQAWGTRDALVPRAAYKRFAARAADRAASFCSLRLSDADHGLQRPDADGLQQLWGWLERWARRPAAGLCAAAPPPGP